MKNVWQIIKSNQKENIFFLPILLLTITISLPLAINNVILVGVILYALFNYSQLENNHKKRYWLPIVLFLLMALSFFWSIDKKLTLPAILKEIALLIIPALFLVIRPFSKKIKTNIIAFFSYSMVIVALFFLLRAVVRFFILQTTQVFFYHGEYDNDVGLVPKVMNAIHVSVFVATAYFYFLSKKIKKLKHIVAIAILLSFLLLLSSKNIIFIFLLLNGIYFVFYTKTAHQIRFRNLFFLLLTLVLLFSSNKIKQRFQLEFQTNTEKSINSNVISQFPEGVHYISISEAWNNKTFTPNDFFPGTAFRVYQFRLFLELLEEEPIFWKGLGLNASYVKLEEKGKKYNVFLGDKQYQGYQKKNFHNQYIQNFVELGSFGFLLLVLMLLFLLRNGIKNKDFTQISFTILMISVFLTESFLWRQRGVLFFTIFYCLFITHTKTLKEDK